MKKIHSVFKGINHSVSLPCVILQQHFSSHQSWLSTNSMLKQSSDLFRFLLQCRPCSVCVTRWCTAVMFGLWSLDLCSSVKRISCSDLVSSTVHVGKNALWLCDGARTILIRGQKLLIWTLNYWGDIVCPPDSENNRIKPLLRHHYWMILLSSLIISYDFSSTLRLCSKFVSWRLYRSAGSESCRFSMMMWGHGYDMTQASKLSACNSHCLYRQDRALYSNLKGTCACCLDIQAHTPLAVAAANPGLLRDLIFDLHWQTIILHSEMSAELFWRSVVIG